MKPGADQRWIEDYERKQGAALGDPNYHLPTHDELYQMQRERDAKKKRERQREDAL